MKAHRVDRREYYIGDKILPAGEYFRNLSHKGKIVEEYLEQARPPNKPKRNAVLYVFEVLEDAYKFWSKMQNGKLYEVEISPPEISHRADMLITESMHDRVENTKTLKQLAKKYWQGKEQNSTGAEIEILIPSPVVTEILSKSESERKEELRKCLRFSIKYS